MSVNQKRYLKSKPFILWILYTIITPFIMALGVMDNRIVDLSGTYGTLLTILSLIAVAVFSYFAFDWKCTVPMLLIKIFAYVPVLWGYSAIAGSALTVLDDKNYYYGFSDAIFVALLMFVLWVMWVGVNTVVRLWTVDSEMQRREKVQLEKDRRTATANINAAHKKDQEDVIGILTKHLAIARLPEPLKMPLTATKTETIKFLEKCSETKDSIIEHFGTDGLTGGKFTGYVESLKRSVADIVQKLVYHAKIMEESGRLVYAMPPNLRTPQNTVYTENMQVYNTNQQEYTAFAEKSIFAIAQATTKLDLLRIEILKLKAANGVTDDNDGVETVIADFDALIKSTKLYKV